MVLSKGGAKRAETLGEAPLLPDTHAHLDAADFGEDCEAVVARAHAAGVDRILAVGSDLASSERAVELAGRFPSVFAAVGFHPHRADAFEADAPAVKALIRADKVVAIGEIGLDYYRGKVAKANQLTTFRRQLDWAHEANLPVSVHNREADSDVLSCLQEKDVRAILHCFSSSSECARSALAAGFTLSFAGNLTFPRANALREVAATVPADRLLIESDAPVLAPQPWRGKRNEPAYVAATAEVLADVRDVPLEALAAQVSKNAQALFGWRQR